MTVVIPTLLIYLYKTLFVKLLHSLLLHFKSEITENISFSLLVMVEQ